MGKYLGYVQVKRSDEKAGVNWFRDGKLGVTYINSETSTGLTLTNVLDEDEVEFCYGEVPEGTPDKVDERINKDIRKEEDYNSLKERLEKIREERKELSKRKRRKTRSKKKSPKQALGNLTEEEKQRLKEMLKGDN